MMRPLREVHFWTWVALAVALALAFLLGLGERPSSTPVNPSIEWEKTR